MAFATVDTPPDLETEDDLVRRYLPLVDYAVADLAGRIPRHVGRDELASAGRVGLAQAARSWDPARGTPFARYAAQRIKGALLDELRARDWASRSVRARARRQQAAEATLTARLGRPPTTAELAEAMGTSSQSVASTAAEVHRAVILNLEALVPDDGTGELPFTSDGELDDDLLDRERRAYLVAAVANLPERLRRVVVGYFFADLGMRELAAELGVTESRISQMRTEALRLLRDVMDSQLDPDRVDCGNLSRTLAARRGAYVTAVANHEGPMARLAAGAGRLASLA